jgi:drug/metabolite transporter (DMT)-like permease
MCYYLPPMWFLYATAASLCWGMSYAASGPLIRKGISPALFFIGYSAMGFLAALLLLATSGKLSLTLRLEGMDRGELGWFLFSVGGSALGAFLTYAAIAGKNPTLASLVEISYPLFVIVFTWVFFREIQLTPWTLAGGLLVMAGVSLTVLGEH